MQNEIARQNKEIYDNISKIENIIMVMSGKGGVGKSTVSVNFALELSKKGKKVGILDMDITGANIPVMLGISGKVFEPNAENKLEPVVVNSIKVASMALVGYKESSALVWRSPVKTQIIRQFLSDINWGQLDYLIIDTPAGTGDEILTLAQNIFLTGAIVVSQPTKVSLTDAQKSITFCKEANINVFGIIENMAYYQCENCKTIKRVVKDENVLLVAKEFDIAFLGSLPIDYEIMQKEDEGILINSNNFDSPFFENIKEITAKVEDKIRQNNELGIYDYYKEEYKLTMTGSNEFHQKNDDDNHSHFKPVR